MAKLQKDIAAAEKTIETKKKLIKDNLEEIEECKQKAVNLDEPLKKEEKLLEKMFEGIKGSLTIANFLFRLSTKLIFLDEVAPLHINLEKIQKELMPFQKNIDEAHARLDLSKNELSLFTSKTEKAREKLEKANADIKSLADTIAQKKKNLSEVRKEIEQGEKELQKAEGELRSLSGADTNLLKEISKARGKAEEASRLLGQEKSQNKIIQQLMKLKKKVCICSCPLLVSCTLYIVFKCSRNCLEYMDALEISARWKIWRNTMSPFQLLALVLIIS